MADIEFGDTHGEQLATVVRVVRDLHRDIYGNGSPGLKKKAEEFMNIAEGVERERARQHKQNSFKLNLIIAICALLTVIIGACSIIVTVALGLTLVQRLTELHGGAVEARAVTDWKRAPNSSSACLSLYRLALPRQAATVLIAAPLWRDASCWSTTIAMCATA